MASPTPEVAQIPAAGGQAADGTIAHKDDPSAQEAYARDDVSGNTGGVQADALHCDNVEKAIF